MIQNFLNGVGRKIAKQRKTNHATQRDVSKTVNISYRYYQSIESGNANITIATLCKLAHYFEVHPCELLPKADEL